MSYSNSKDLGFKGLRIALMSSILLASASQCIEAQGNSCDNLSGCSLIDFGSCTTMAGCGYGSQVGTAWNTWNCGNGEYFSCPTCCQWA